MRSFLSFCNHTIEYAFYALFFVVPLTFHSSTSELFEFNKMWLTFTLTVIIGTAWFTKMIVQKRFRIQRTPLDIPILLFLLSQIIATFHSLDPHVSLWGYYSRFNGGLFSILSYIFLYYAFVSNFFPAPEQEAVSLQPKAHKNKHLPKKIFDETILAPKKMVQRLLLIGLGSGILVALWGFPSHFGYDPTCLLFRGSLDVDCWTEAFQPKVRIFSTLGQPNWLAAYLAILIPIFLSVVLVAWKRNTSRQSENILPFLSHKALLLFSFPILALFYLDLLYTRSQSGFLGLSMALFFFAIFYVLLQKRIHDTTRSLITASKSKIVLGALVLFGLLIFFVGQPIPQLERLTLPGIKNLISTTPQQQETTQQAAGPALEYNITASGDIRAIVWKGALDIWKANPLFGTGVETFAFAYYKHRPVEHNLTSEWDYLYNKAHNEYLNYLATTGAFGLGSYLLMIGWFLFISIKTLLDRKNVKAKMQDHLLVLGLLSAYLSILVTNFFGFSVVIVNIFFFLIPAFVFLLQGTIRDEQMFAFPKKTTGNQMNQELSPVQLTGITIVTAISIVFLWHLLAYWRADTAYAMGSNLNKVNEYTQAYLKLAEAVDLRSDEPVFQDELSFNAAALATVALYQKDATTAATYTQQAVAFSDHVVKNHPNNVVFWKTRTRLFYTLGQVDPKYLPQALEAVRKAHELAPTDAKVLYNLAVLEGQTGKPDKAIELLQETIAMKPDYRDAYYALGLFYHEEATNDQGAVINPALHQKAVETMQYILQNISKDDAQAKEALETWGVQ